MTEHPHPERSEANNSPRSPERSRSWWPVAAPAVALVIGVLIGGVVVGVADDDDAASTSRTSPTPTISPTVGDPTGSPTEGATTTIVVPEACLDAVDTAEEATELIREGATAIRAFRPAELRALLTELEELDQRAREQAQACRDARVE